MARLVANAEGPKRILLLMTELSYLGIEASLHRRSQDDQDDQDDETTG